MRRSVPPERVLLPAVHGGLALVLLTPLVWAPDAWHPFTVGKAVYTRSLIAVTFALWVPLALARPRFRPPPTAILAALLAGFAVAVLSAGLGVSPQRSLWSTYTRMEGLVDTAHWVAFAVVLMATVRTGRDWNRLLNANLCVGLAVALAAVARFQAPEAGAFGLPSEGRYPRVSATTANPTFLGAYLQAIVLLAAGFLARSFCARPVKAGSAGGAAPRRGARGGRRAVRRRRAPVRAPSQPSARLFWAATVASGLFALMLTGSMGALAGLGAGVGAAAVLFARFGPSRRARRLGFAGLGALGVAAAVVAFTFASRAGTDAARPAFDSIMLERITSPDRVGNTLGGRLRNWEAGLEAFAERPLLGWGTGNYFVASARHIAPPRPGRRTEITDHAHNMIVEEAATKGLAGLAAYLLLWSFTAAAVVRGVRTAAPREQTLAIFVGAALAGWFVQSQTLFYTPSSWLQHMLLLAFAAHLQATTARKGRGRLRAALGGALEALRLRAVRFAVPVRVAVTVAVVAAAGGSIAANRAIHTANAAILRAENGESFLEDLERSMRAFEPLANGPRVILFNNVAANWPVVAEHDSDLARRLLEWTGEEAAAALAAEPESWVIHHALARLYRAIAATHPDYAEPAQRHFDRSLALAPGLDPLEAPTGAPARP